MEEGGERRVEKKISRKEEKTLGIYYLSEAPCNMSVTFRDGQQAG